MINSIANETFDFFILLWWWWCSLVDWEMSWVNHLPCWLPADPHFDNNLWSILCKIKQCVQHTKHLCQETIDAVSNPFLWGQLYIHWIGVPCGTSIAPFLFCGIVILQILDEILSTLSPFGRSWPSVNKATIIESVVVVSSNVWQNRIVLLAFVLFCNDSNNVLWSSLDKWPWKLYLS